MASTADRPHAAALASRIRGTRQQAGYSLSALARRAGLPKSTLSAIEAGRSNPTLATIIAVADALLLEPCDLLCRDADHGATSSERADAVRAELYGRADLFDHPETYRNGVADALAHA